MRMIDLHTHLLPQMDDGSKSVEESHTMLGALVAQGVDTVAATPHFYANDESVGAFLERREAALSRLGATDVNLLCGAEVRYYPGIAHMDALPQLQIERSGLLLLEMPFARWTEYTVRELCELADSRGLQLVLAHIERYLPMQKAAVWQRLYESGILMQVNARFVTAPTTRRKALRMLAEGRIHFLGSDCHNTTTRPPQLAPAAAVIEKRLGAEFMSQMNEFGHTALGQNKTVNHSFEKG